MFTSSTKLFQGITPASGAVTSTGRSLRFNSADSTYLSRTPASTGNRQKWTYSFWIKRSAVSGATARTVLSADSGSGTSNYSDFYFNDNGGAVFICDFGPDASRVQGTTTAVFRDAGAWMHGVIAVDTTQATAANRVKVYFNNVLFSLSGYPSQNYNTDVNTTIAHAIGRRGGVTPDQYLDGYMTEIYLIDGQQLDPSSFGQTDSATGVWVPISYTGTYGTNGFYLNFQDNSGTTATTLGKDSSGNGNNWTPNNFSVTAGAGNDSLVDYITNAGTDTGAGGEVRGNYATFNPLVAAGGTFTNGNLDFTAADNGLLTPTTVFPSSGKWYCEIVWNSGANPRIGVTNTAGLGNNLGSTANSWAYLYDGRLFNNNTVGNNTGVSATTGDVVMLALDLDAGKLWYGKNGTWMPPTTGGTNGNPAAGTNATQTFTANQVMSFAVSSGGGTPAWTGNFGQRPFAYTAPSGFKALCTQNLPTPTIGASSTTLADDYFNAVIWTGDGSSTRTITGVGFQPDFVWAKNRSTSAVDHSLYDVIRGAGNDKELISNSTSVEGGGNHDAYGWLSAFASDGFTTTKGTGVNYYFNENLATYVAWNWKASGAGSNNTSGTITSNVSVSTAAGFSVVIWTGNGSNNATIGHGLGTSPNLVITKARDRTQDWVVYGSIIGGGANALSLNSTSQLFTPSAGHISTFGATTLTLTQGSSSIVNLNASSNTYVAYCFAEITGYSKVGKYTGNGNTDGPFVYCGFRPRFILAKRTDITGDWIMTDSSRSPYNVVDKRLFANTSDAESSATGPYDYLSNGFKLRNTNANENALGGNYIFIAFAESPFNYSRAR